MNVLVTGSRGFLGRQVTTFLDLKYQGYVLTNERNIQVKNFNQLKGDILRVAEFESKLKNIDAVIHLAAINKAETEQEYKKLFETNVLGTFNMLELAKKMGASRFIFASSAAVYGENKHRPLKETFPPHPTSLYGLSKLLCEKACLYYGSDSDFSIVCLRISNMYGPGQPLGFLVPDLFENAKNHDIIEVHNPAFTRDFVHVDDVSRAIEKSLNKYVSGIINIGSGKEVSILDIAVQLGEFLGKRVCPLCNSDDSVQRSVLDINKARKNLNWVPQVSLKKGLKETWQHMIANPGD